MDYKKIYESLIDKRRKHPIAEGYSEKHHVIPRCLGGSNAKDNIVRLTAREHYIAHLLLVHVYPGPKMLFAIRSMSRRSKNHLGHREFLMNSRLFQLYREKAIEVHKGFVTVRDKDGKTFHVSKDDPRFLSGELVPISKGQATVRDKDGNIFNVSVDDPRYLSGELVGYWKGKKRKKHSKATIERMKLSHKGKHTGSKNSQFGTKWICNISTKENKKISKNNPIPEGWIKGRNKWKICSATRQSLDSNC